MTDTLPEIRAFLETSDTAFEVWECSPDLADTAVFCEHYQVSLDHSANAILVRANTDPQVVIDARLVEVTHDHLLFAQPLEQCRGGMVRV